MKRNLNKLFNPKSVAVIGASRTKGKVGHDVLKNILTCGYDGKVYPINPNANKIFGLKAYKSIKDIKSNIDLAVFAIPSTLVPQALKECGQKKVPNAIIISAGFKESGSEGARLERLIAEIGKKFRISILGPNCLGLIDTASCLNASFAAKMPQKGNIAFFSQSGALGTAILDWSLHEDIGFSKFVSLGNKVDVKEVDLLEVFENDPQTDVILGYIEDIKDGARFMKAAKRISKKKPIILTKSGGTEAGARAASSHTGSLAGSDKAFSAAFKQCGVIRADTVEDLFDYARAFSYQPLPKGTSLAIVTNAGGPGVMAADSVENSKVVNLSSFGKQTLDILRKSLPAGASLYNPVDLMGDAQVDRYKKALEAVLKDQSVDGVLVILTPQAMSKIRETAELVTKINTHGKPIFTCFLGGRLIKQGIDVLRQGRIPNYTFPERAVHSFSTMVRFMNWKKTPKEHIPVFEVAKDNAAKILDSSKAQGHYILPEYLSQQIISSYGFKLPKSFLAKTAQEASMYADQIGYPVVMKIASPDILHKSDVGGVKVGLDSKEKVEESFYAMTQKAKRIMPQANVVGVLVQEMISQGKEVIVGMVKDPQFGSLVMFGLGGVYVEILKDVSFRIAPLSQRDADFMIKEIRSYPILAGARGEEPIDMDSLRDCILRLSQLVMDFPEIAELDINPIKVMPKSIGGSYAIDVRMALSAPVIGAEGGKK